MQLYTAGLISNFFKTQKTLPFREIGISHVKSEEGLTELILGQKARIAMTEDYFRQGFYDSLIHLWKKLPPPYPGFSTALQKSKPVIFLDYNDLINGISMDDSQILFVYENKLMVDYLLAESCDSLFAFPDKSTGNTSFVMGFRKNFPDFNRFKNLIMTLTDSTFDSILKTIYRTRKKTCGSGVKPREIELGLSKLQGVFSLLLGGTLCAVIMFVTETFVKRSLRLYKACDVYNRKIPKSVIYS